MFLLSWRDFFVFDLCVMCVVIVFISNVHSIFLDFFLFCNLFQYYFQILENQKKQNKYANEQPSNADEQWHSIVSENPTKIHFE